MCGLFCIQKITFGGVIKGLDLLKMVGICGLAKARLREKREACFRSAE